MSGADDSVFTIAVQPDNKVLLGGLFFSVDGSARSEPFEPDATDDEHAWLRSASIQRCCLGELSKTLLPGAIAVKRKSLALFPSELRIVL
jgi:hypothetical protein